MYFLTANFYIYHSNTKKRRVAGSAVLSNDFMQWEGIAVPLYVDLETFNHL